MWGNNDTSVIEAMAAGGVPGGGENPMLSDRNRAPYESLDMRDVRGQIAYHIYLKAREESFGLLDKSFTHLRLTLIGEIISSRRRYNVLEQKEVLPGSYFKGNPNYNRKPFYASE